MVFSMANGRLSPVLRHLRRVIPPTGNDGVSDAQLLERFVLRNDEAAFELLLWRHGPMVWSLCRRMLPDFHEAEDAFQAAMLVLARKAGSISKRRSLASWLFKVAFRIALRARADSLRRVKLHEQLQQWPARIFIPEEGNGYTELRPLIDEGLNELPEKYRAPVVLCYLQNKTNEEAARQLRCPVGTVKTRLAKARALLSRWLRHRGIVLSTAGLASILTPPSKAALPAGLLTTALQAAMVASAGTVGAAAVSVRALLLMEGTMKAMFWTKMKIVTAVVLFVGVAGSGAGMISYHSWASDQFGNEALVTQEPGNTSRPEKPPIVPPPPELQAALAERDKAAADLKAAESNLNAAKFYLGTAEAKFRAVQKKIQADQPSDPKQPVAFIFDTPITREQLADYLITNYGADKLEQLVNKLIIERACREKSISVTDADIDGAIKEDMKSMACNDQKAFESAIKKHHKSLLEWREDVVKPRLGMSKLARMRVSVSEEDIRKAFEGAYGEKVACEIILQPKGKDESQTKFAIIGDLEELVRFAKQHFNGALVSWELNFGSVGSKGNANDLSENGASRLRPGETWNVEMTEGTISVKCIRRIPPDKSVKLEDVRAQFTEQVLAKKTQQEIPKLFEELRKQAQPRLLLKK